MTPEDEIRYAEIIRRLQAEQMILSARMEAMEGFFEGAVNALGVKKQGQPPVSELVKMKTVLIVDGQLNELAKKDPVYASELREILNEYKQKPLKEDGRN